MNDGTVIEVPTVLAEVVDLEMKRELLPYSDGKIWDEGRIVREILGRTEQMVVEAYEIGRLLMWTKGELPHGAFGTWCERCLPQFNDRTLRKYMQLAEFLVAHPALMQPLAGAGIKKVLLLTTLAPDQVGKLLEDTATPEAPIKDIESISYAELQDRIRKLTKQGEVVAAKLAEKERDLELARTTIADVTSAVHGTDRELLTRVEEARVHFTDAMRKMRAELNPLVARWREGNLPVELRGEVLAMLEYAQVLTSSELLLVRERVGEGVYSAELLALMESERPLATKYSIPQDLVPPRHRKTVDDGENKPAGRKGKS